jgi:type II secretory ATPase GspE/PulE/Tfp pilus assembly ATPase PilB-like protein
VFERLHVMCADHSAVATSVELVLNQRLVRKLCRACSGAGCASCLNTGYRDRIPLVESLRVDESTRKHLAALQFDKIAAKPSLQDHAQALLHTGLTNASELRSILGIDFAT